ncbi:MAG: hypothetical protein DRJ03_28730 [Chloroflexi bacterium]|nr:MAG: hypothetical protein DRJ03_28730 [Chloroflexota bacterium]
MRMGLQPMVATRAPVPMLDWRGGREIVGERRFDQREREELLRGWWEAAVMAWLDSKQAKTGSLHTRRAYETDVRLFFEFCQAQPWQVGGAHVVRWQQEQRERGLSEKTINRRIASLSSLFDFCCYKFTVTDPAGHEISLATTNPARRVDRAAVNPYENAEHLSIEELRAMFRCIPRDSVVGLRDRALVLTYFYTGRRSTEIRTLRWGEITEEDGRRFYRWTGKGNKPRTDELPLPAYNAIVEYLEAAGRLEGMGENDFIFTALSDVATRLPGVDAMPDEALSSSFVNRVVKKCARRAGLQWRRIHTHTLRHTAAMLRYDLRKDIRELQDFLGHASMSTTQIYLTSKQKRTDTLWAEVEALIGAV